MTSEVTFSYYMCLWIVVVYCIPITIRGGGGLMKSQTTVYRVSEDSLDRNGVNIYKLVHIYNEFQK